jgi:hypothetical protein
MRKHGRFAPAVKVAFFRGRARICRWAGILAGLGGRVKKYRNKILRSDGNYRVPAGIPANGAALE